MKKVLVVLSLASSFLLAGYAQDSPEPNSPDLVDQADEAVLDGGQTEEIDGLVSRTTTITDHQIGKNGTLLAGDRLTSSNGFYRLVLQKSDGNLVLYNNFNAPLWSSGTNGKGVTHLSLESDGNLVLLTSSNKQVWASNTGNMGVCALRLKNDGHLALYNNDYQVVKSLHKPTTAEEVLKADTSRGEWTLVTVPDTQHYSMHNDIFLYWKTAFQWLVSNRDMLNLKMVQGLGDITNDNTEDQYVRARSAYDILVNANVPCSVIPGAHDSAMMQSTDFSLYRKYFPVSIFDSTSWWGGCFNDGMENNYMLMTIGNEKYLFLNTSDRPDASEVDWAKGILDTYSDRKAIVTTHDNSGDTTVEDSILKQNYKQIVLFNCGHCTLNLHWNITPNNGVNINCFQTDYQGDKPEIMLLRFFKFKPLEGEVEFYTYSPAKKVFDYRNPVSQGSFTLVQK